MRELFVNHFHHFTAINYSLIVNIKVYITFTVPSDGFGTIVCYLGVFSVVMDGPYQLSIIKQYMQAAALFESHLSFGISVWGVALKQNDSDKVFITQKHSIRVLFGDLDAYLDKLATCARVREFGKQKLGSKFYTKEHTKPLFNRLVNCTKSPQIPYSVTTI